MPSPPVIAALGRVLGIARSELLDLVAPPRPSPHLLLYQTGTRSQSAAHAGQYLFGDGVDGWIEVGVPGASDPRRALAALEALLADHGDVTSAPRLGLIFGTASRSRDRDLRTLLEREATWESDVAGLCRRLLGVEPVANICVYREEDIRRRAREPDPLTSALRLIRSHPTVAVQGSAAGVLTGPAAIETMLVGLAPAATDADTWKQLVGAAAIGLADDAGIRAVGGEP